jgi:hypothetical protein
MTNPHTSLPSSTQIFKTIITGPLLPKNKCPQATEGEDSHLIWKTAVNILNKQSRTDDKEWPLSVVVG